MPHKGVDLSWHDPQTSFLECVLARGGREVSDVIESAWRAGAVFDAWTEEFDPGRWHDAMERSGVDGRALANQPRDPSRATPWEHIDTGLTRGFLLAERDRAYEGVVTEDCTFGECTGCGVCPSLGVDIRLSGVRRG